MNLQAGALLKGKYIVDSRVQDSSVYLGHDADTYERVLVKVLSKAPAGGTHALAQFELAGALFVVEPLDRAQAAEAYTPPPPQVVATPPAPDSPPRRPPSTPRPAPAAAWKRPDPPAARRPSNRAPQQLPANPTEAPAGLQSNPDAGARIARAMLATVLLGFGCLAAIGSAHPFSFLCKAALVPFMWSKVGRGNTAVFTIVCYLAALQLFLMDAGPTLFLAIIAVVILSASSNG